jgi:fatty acid desaturase
VKRERPFLPFAADLYSIALVAGMLGLMVLPFAVPLPAPVAAVWIVFAGFVNIAVNLVNHNHTHVRTFGREWANRVFEYLLTLTRGSSATFIAIIHNRNHHHFEGTERDWFAPSNQGDGPPWRRPVVYVMRTLNRFRTGARTRSMPAKLRRAIRREHAALAVFLLALAWLDWQKLVLYVGLPLTFGNLFTVLTNLLHHDGAVAGAGPDVSYSYLSPLENRLFLNGGYHAMHHQEPALHWSELARAHAERLRGRQSPGMERWSMFARVLRGYAWPAATCDDSVTRTDGRCANGG